MLLRISSWEAEDFTLVEAANDVNAPHHGSKTGGKVVRNQQTVQLDTDGLVRTDIYRGPRGDEANTDAHKRRVAPGRDASLTPVLLVDLLLVRCDN